MSGDERPTVTWMHYSTTLTNRTGISITVTYAGDYQITSNLTLSNVNQYSAGIYQCIGSNSLNTVTVETRLTVKCKLIFKSTWLYFDLIFTHRCSYSSTISYWYNCYTTK